MDAELTRRDVIKLGAAAAVAVSIASEPLGAQTPAGFFSSGELALVDELSELIIPADDHSPGARAAKVAAYIDARLAEAVDPEERSAWREGLRSFDRLSEQQSGGRAFLAATRDQQIALLTALARHEAQPQTPDERFFVEVKSRVVEAYYSSEIGVKEMEYKGNVPQAEFSGTDVSGR
jgi:hypothetical protein